MSALLDRWRRLECLQEDQLDAKLVASQANSSSDVTESEEEEHVPAANGELAGRARTAAANGVPSGATCDSQGLARRLLKLGLGGAACASALLMLRRTGLYADVGATWWTGTRGEASTGLLAEFDLLQTYRTVMQADPFQFHCPLPLFSVSALKHKNRHDAFEACCHDYEAMPPQWPYQFPECGQQACTTCWRQSGEPELARHAPAGLAAAAYATSVAVSGPRVLGPKAFHTERRLETSRPRTNHSSKALGRRLEAKDETRHAGLPFKKILAPVQYGLRDHVANLCPRISDWEEYFLNDDAENTHARVYKSASERLAVVAFRGTQPGSLRNWQTDMDITMRTVSLESTKGDGANTTVHIHEGFLQAAERVLPHVRKWVEGYIEGTKGMFNIPSGWRLLFTGHSLGGALALLTATMAEAHGWSRTPDAVVTFGSPRVADGNLSAWWEGRGLCKKLLRINVYNDAITWMPFFNGLAVAGGLLDCMGDLTDCFRTANSGGSADHTFDERWRHICPESEFLVPGAMKGVNQELQEFSVFGGILSHFLSNGQFGYGYGIQYGGVLLHDDHCGLSPEAFPRSECSVLQDLTGVQCMGLDHDASAASLEVCRSHCCDDPYCEVWSWMQNGKCWRGRSQDCKPDRPASRYVVAAERLH